METLFIKLLMARIIGLIIALLLVTFVLVKIGIINHKLMSHYRKHAIVLIFVIGALITPPDPISQIMVAVPLIIFYEISIWVARIARRKTII